MTVAVTESFVFLWKEISTFLNIWIVKQDYLIFREENQSFCTQLRKAVWEMPSIFAAFRPDISPFRHAALTDS